ncbi:hypothetical protein DVS28_a2976 [Euzebya pacifica]|uniref:Uncharacterized protein n=1 Tax=Euzebya pacifica TaxID=1608957 RepID=A0A346XZK8_9ACTN|nr:hypothetical protein DVS28_a2976 [Euzebya pacifica]
MGQAIRSGGRPTPRPLVGPRARAQRFVVRPTKYGLGPTRPEGVNSDVPRGPRAPSAGRHPDPGTLPHRA